ncbi:S-adenosyl-l-methionine hydroxide adenosyltransferase family protein [Sporolactobacillus shoreicorticis]|uniref:S-adenosyl-l-methionine hydroxide adenosyltransferase family protein n=1 Tax=Sporolactobacillus shoreicorticis TaxID=1923877 RepID=A0ABW5S7S4_9BACL|nr:S-adenosyl-l-methionine hydroxide adenosyltransferase family protein [Sporolactobacillus shoreicorticis]MCO7126919.1 S-adenosyl-l-methionine hydroxide adenosyltransferase family protein [Sporolactobacillus shoreicorticis]
MSRALVFQTDFGLADGAVCAMYGVANSVDQKLKIYDLTHDIPQYNIWEASYRLRQTIDYWPEGTVFVSVVDPGVGSTRRSVIVRTRRNQYIITPDNGTLTHIKRIEGIESAHTFDERANKLPTAGESFTFFGRDIYAFNGAKLASGIIDYDDFGESVSVDSLVELPIIPSYREGGQVIGTIDVLDVRFGNLWTNIDHHLFHELNVSRSDRLTIKIKNDTRTVYKNTMIFARSFAEVAIGEPLLYINSLENVGIAINQGSFAKAYSIGTGTNWHISIDKA